MLINGAGPEHVAGTASTPVRNLVGRHFVTEFLLTLRSRTVLMARFEPAVLCVKASLYWQ